MNYQSLIIILGITSSMVSSILAGDVFPSFSKVPIEITISTNLTGTLIDTTAVVGTNYVYNMNGQIFTNSIDGHIQTTAEDFSGVTDKSTPWKTLTELLAAYQRGCSEKELRSLYSEKSQDYLADIYKSKEVTDRFKRYGASITNMNVCLGFDFANGFIAFVKIDHAYGSQRDPLYFVKSNNKYLLSTYTSDETNINNIMVYLSSSSVTNLIKL